jgi:serine/threonine protein phosphatase 1
MRWLIGDLHGMLKPLETLLREIERADSRATIYFVGDYVNRGPESRGVIDLVLSLKNAKCIRGNHDDVLDQILHGIGYAENASRGDRFIAFTWFLEHGLLETLQSYGATHDQIVRVVRQRSRDAIQPVIDLFPIEHRNFIRSLPVYIDDNDLFVIHGKWPLKESSTPDQVLSRGVPEPALRNMILWGRFTDAEIPRRKAWPKAGFFGHTPIATYNGYEHEQKPIIGARMILLDTAAALSAQGRLTTMCAENSQIIQTDPKGRLIRGGETSK